MLPEIKYPVHSLVLPSNGQTITFRGYNTREHKTLLHSIEVLDKANFVDTILQLIQVCVYDELDVESLPMFDIDFIYLNLRIHSVGDSVPISYRCLATDEEGKVCNAITKVDLDLNEIKVVFPQQYDDKKIIKIDKTSGLKMKSPNFRVYRKLAKNDSLNDESIIFECIEAIFNGDSVYVPGKDFTLQEFVTFYDELPAKTIEQITQFFRDLPYIALTTKIACGSCGNSSELVIKELEDFFV